MNDHRTKVAAKVAAGDVGAMLLGRRHHALRVLRQAYRLRDDHTDELIELSCGREYWLAARLGDRVSVWACNDRDAADDAFELRLEREPDWREAVPSDQRPAA